MIVVGIDPGKKGGIAAVTLGGDFVMVQPTQVFRPKKGSRPEYDISWMVEILTNLKEKLGIRVVVVEKLHALPKIMGGGIANYQRGLGFGLWVGLCYGLGLPLRKVPPQTWQKVMLAGQNEGDTKVRSIIAAQELFPAQADQFRPAKSKNWHDGMCDATLMAVYGQRYVLNAQ